MLGHAAIHLQRLPKCISQQIVLSMLCEALMIGSLHLDDELCDSIYIHIYIVFLMVT